MLMMFCFLMDLILCDSWRTSREACCLETCYKVSSKNSHASMFRDISVYRDSSNVENSMWPAVHSELDESIAKSRLLLRL